MQPTITHPGRAQSPTTFADNMRLPVHRWFRYSAGFSAELVLSILAEVDEATVLDPFAGSATTLLAAQSGGAESIGIDPHPFVSRVAEAKLSWTADVSEFRAASALVASTARAQAPSAGLPPLLAKAYPQKTLGELLGYLAAVESVDAGAAVRRLLWLAFVAMVRPTSPVGTAQWQYVQPNRSKAKSMTPADAWLAQTSMMASDMAQMQATTKTVPSARFLAEDARLEHREVPSAWASHVITSPPYANNYDYADATRLEQSVLGEVSGWSDLKEIRRDLVHACSQHMSGYAAEEALAHEALDPIRDELLPAYERLSEVRLERGGRKAYHSMIVAYFLDLAQVWRRLRRVVAGGGEVCFVVGDSAPYGVHVPVERWLGALAVSAGFEAPRFEKTRDRNTKWRNRKHRVPLHEGYLRVRG